GGAWIPARSRCFFFPSRDIITGAIPQHGFIVTGELAVYAIVSFIGFLAGMFTGYFLVLLVPEWFGKVPMNYIGSGFVGGFFGAIIGTLSPGDPNKATGGGADYKLAFAAIFGIIGGLLGGTKFQIVPDLLRLMGIRVFW